MTVPGTMVRMPDLRFEFRHVQAFPTSLHGAVQHNAWWDAMALRHILEPPRNGQMPASWSDRSPD